MSGVDLNFYSAAISRVKVHSETGAKLGDATGFIVRQEERTIFVTAWHVISGRNFHSKKHVHSSGALPSFVALTFWGTRFLSPDKQHAEFRHFPDLIRLDGLEDTAVNPRNIHPHFGHDVDVVAIDITNLANEVKSRTGFEIIGIDLAKEEKLKPVSVMDQVFIPGYPVINTPKPNEMPIYKAATIASEPNVFINIPSVLIDGKTKHGWSGSPVIRKIPVHKPTNDQSVLFKFEEFVLYAIYSGRDENDREMLSAELGYCWPVRECLVPILEQLR